jgi:hypothetical protein
MSLSKAPSSVSSLELEQIAATLSTRAGKSGNSRDDMENITMIYYIIIGVIFISV